MKPSMAPLPSWREGRTRDAILAFLEASHGIPVGNRTAIFDHDGTLRCEKPTLLLFDFMVHKVRTAAATRPDVADRADYQLILRGDPAEVARFGLRRCLAAVYELVAGMTPQEFTSAVRDFVHRRGSAHSRTDYRQLVYQPMLELIRVLRDAEFTVLINARYSVEFVRAISRDYYGVPPHCVVGTTVDYEYEYRDSGPALVRRSTIIGEIGRGATNVVNIQTQTGLQPILAAGNSTSDREILEYATASEGPSLALLIEHDDPEREYAYHEHFEARSGSESFVDLARHQGWTVVSMHRDWSTIFPPA